MKSAKFLLIHVVTNTLLMLACAVYILFSRYLDSLTDDALLILQLLGVIPGVLFAIGKCLLMPDLWPAAYAENVSRSTQMCAGVRQGTKVCLAVIFSLLDFLLLGPAVFWTVIYKWLTMFLA